MVATIAQLDPASVSLKLFTHVFDHIVVMLSCGSQSTTIMHQHPRLADEIHRLRLDLQVKDRLGTRLAREGGDGGRCPGLRPQRLASTQFPRRHPGLPRL